MSISLDPEEIFGRQGPLSKKLQYFEFRPSQIDYARAVREALVDKRIALLEAQTGTGKTLGYLIPALEKGTRVLISTGTKALQEQLFHKDLPLIREKLGINFEYVLMKGRMNYLCLLKMERAQMEPRLPDEESVEQFQQIAEWAHETDTGDIAESGIPDHAPVWRELTISSDQCLGAKCRFFNQCFVFKVKQRAEDAQIVVVNHHLFFSDLSLQLASSTSIFPEYNTVIFDEAHQLADIATHNLSIGFSQHKFHEVMQDLAREMQIVRVKEKVDTQPVLLRARRVSETVENLFGKFITLPQKLRYNGKSISRVIGADPSVLEKMFAALLEELVKLVDKTEDMPQIYRRIMMQQSSLSFLLAGGDEAYVYWAERSDVGLWSLQASPLDVSGVLGKSLWPNLESAVLTSATLFVDQKCDPIKQDLGIGAAIEHTFPYNFNYPEQACLYIPKNVPDPTDPRFPDAAAEQIGELVNITEGGAFVLCTSYSNMKRYELELRRYDYPLFVQGTRSKQQLLKSFTKKRGAILLATMSFWQGIDVQGDSLVSVIIDKLPFAVPNDPLIEAKIQYLQKQKRNSFLEYQLPAAVMLLKQGIGRLIRTSVDYGLLAVLDRRLVTKSYGAVFLRNLPAMPIIQDLAALKSAFDERRDRFTKFHQ